MCASLARVVCASLRVLQHRLQNRLVCEVRHGGRAWRRNHDLSEVGSELSQLDLLAVSGFHGVVGRAHTRISILTQVLLVGKSTLAASILGGRGSVSLPLLVGLGVCHVNGKA